MNTISLSHRQTHPAVARFVQNILTPSLTAIAKPGLPKVVHEPRTPSRSPLGWPPHRPGSPSPLLTKLGQASSSPASEQPLASSLLNCHKLTQHWAQSPP